MAAGKVVAKAGIASGESAIPSPCPLHSQGTPHPTFGYLLPIRCGEGKSEGRGAGSRDIRASFIVPLFTVPRVKSFPDMNSNSGVAQDQCVAETGFDPGWPAGVTSIRRDSFKIHIWGSSRALA